MKKIALMALMLSIVGCTKTQNPPQSGNPIQRTGYLVNTQHPSQSQNERVRFLILHYTAANDTDSMRLLTQGNVSAHYLVPSANNPLLRKNTVYQLVAEDKRAWHAGVSAWNGRTNLNDSAIGIENVNLGYEQKLMEREWYAWDARQIKLLARLASDIIKRYDITPDNVLGHSDVAPTRKVDPGPLFPWKQLADEGIGAWPDSTTVQQFLAGRAPSDTGSPGKIQAYLARYGYSIPQTGVMDATTRQVIAVFQMHFRPSDYSGIADAETEAIAAALVEKYRGGTQRIASQQESNSDL